jgi:periplasmic divalent cation tolerance protein
MRYYLLYITTKDEAEAKRIGQALVKERLAACVNIHPVESIYWWEGEINHESEVAILAKTKSYLVDEATARVKELHSYEVPCIICFPIEKGYPDYLEWINQSTK